MNKILFFLSLIFSFSLVSQTQEDAWVFFKDKPNAASFIANPISILSQRALDRRTKQNIIIDEKDVPIEVTYYNQIKNTSGITVKAKSKWLNAVHVQGLETVITELKANFSFIEKIEFANRNIAAISRAKKTIQINNHQNKLERLNSFNYGVAENQIAMLKGDFLHEQGYTGSGMQIAVIDAGFPNVNSLTGFQRLRDNNQILGGYDFVNRNENFYTGSSHGTHVLSDIGGYIENEFIGTAPDASFYLFITEDAANESPLEESLWVEAAERADSLGVDVINTSLGYTTFDRADYNYTNADMDGKTTFITRGAAIGATRGMILVNSAGNSGNGSWRIIGAPADAENVFSIGAVRADRTIVGFSSRGPTADGRIKPDVMAQGAAPYVLSYTSGNPGTTNGTSFSSPILAGVIACFWQAYPNTKALELLEEIRKASDNYETPNNDYGYGIPNFETAFNTLKIAEEVDIPIQLFPNPVNEELNFNQAIHSDIHIFSVLGEKVYIQKEVENTANTASLRSGIYILQYQKNKKIKYIKFIKN